MCGVPFIRCPLSEPEVDPPSRDDGDGRAIPRLLR
jgi:hypothetical protein